jgi:predicted ester cyclase
VPTPAPGLRGRQDNITIGRALLDALNGRDLSQWEAMLAADFTCSYPGFRGEYGKEAAKAYNAPFSPAFPDLHFDILQTLANGDTVIYVWNAKGTHNGPLALPTGNVPPTGKYAEVQAH